eukprot:CAMPEP_0115555062 /NCGR_PEP_ID=MMETSP0271-20121206/97623_1 /TAXON_ID=71861 /ORGANISM="Scrippsiella trochoidea, Strain CCMP3099" /LENGTH=83 /DNA_ID=CAMNT_0002988823 /DNA_START=179 /DNA_END=430 /DNA_ORIENTATION=+
MSVSRNSPVKSSRWLGQPDSITQGGEGCPKIASSTGCICPNLGSTLCQAPSNLSGLHARTSGCDMPPPCPSPVEICHPPKESL